MRNGNLTLREFLLHHTRVYELCVIRDQGWIIATVWVDDEDLFIGNLKEKLLNKTVIDDHWTDSFPISKNPEYFNEGHMCVPAHYIDV